jgi:hypothetical protein
VRGYFASITTDSHAAPMTSMVLSCVIKKEHAQRVLTFLDKGEIARAQEVSRSFGKQPEQMIRFLGLHLIPPLKFSAPACQLRIPETITQHFVDGLNRGLRNGPASGHPLD